MDSEAAVPVRLCRDCRHCKPASQWEDDPIKALEYSKCEANYPRAVNLVSGEPINSYCSTMRSGDDCGPTAKLFEPKP